MKKISYFRLVPPVAKPITVSVEKVFKRKVKVERVIQKFDFKYQSFQKKKKYLFAEIGGIREYQKGETVEIVPCRKKSPRTFYKVVEW